ncbi:MAG: energy transducer TonB [Verrucomicrobiota bacterium]|nr:energy transducer TonB [Verrucomicrobiota bacterium]
MRIAFSNPLSSSAGFLSWSDRQKLIAAIAASVLLHLIACLVMILWTAFQPERVLTKIEADVPLEVTVTPPELKFSELSSPLLPPARVSIDTEGMKEVDKTSEDAPFESDKNTAAASEQPASGTAPLPSQDGKNLPFIAFQNQDYSLGKKRGDEARARDDTPTTQPRPSPMFQPTPIPSGSAAPPAPEQNSSVLPKPTPVKTNPADLRLAITTATVPKPAPSVTATPTAAPALTELPRPTPVQTTPRPELAMLAATPALRTKPATGDEPGYRPQLEKTKIEGSISNRGKSSVASVGGPLGKYRKSTADAIGSRWYYYVDQRRGLVDQGAVQLRFFVKPDGKVDNVEVTSNTSNSAFASLCVDSVLQAELQPIPPDISENLDNGRLEITYTFTLY